MTNTKEEILFRSFSLDKFGKRLKTIRTDLGLTMRSVSEATGINKNTLVDIESGRSYPKYETLEILSVLYKVDLLALLITSRSSDSFLNIYQQIDLAMTTLDKNLINKLKGDIKNIQASEVIDNVEKEQLRLLIEAMSARYSNFSTNSEEAVDILLTALKIRIPSFNPENVEYFKYNFIEMRLLFTLAAIYGSAGEIDISIKILYYLKDKMPETIYQEELRNRMLIRILSQLAYNNYRLGDDEKTIEVSNEGIELCINNYIYENLDILYFRKGIALLNLKNEDYIIFLKKSLYILYSTNNMARYEIYVNSLKDNYGIEIQI